MPATTRTARACALALAGVGLTASTLTAPSATAVTGTAPTSTSTSTTSTTSTDDTRHTGATPRGTAKGAAKDRERRRERRAARRVNDRVLGARDTAMRQRGDAYAYGASGPNSFDCSGLVYYSFRRAGFPVPRTSAAQAGFTRRIAKADMRAGDLMFFFGSGGVYHAAIFLRWSHGHALMLHAPSPGERVQVSVPWTSQWFGGTLRRR